VQYLAHSASFHSDDEIAPSKPGIKHLETEELAILVACVAAILAMPRPAAEARAKIVPDAYAAHDAARAAETPSGA
jgi:hypothetical protein